VWRRRSRRAQVSAVATILGLLLVVTFIANYITTTLPNQMQLNDLNHEVAVENQLGQLQSVLYAAASAGAIGAQFSQPLSLGSLGDPPFADPDGGTLVAGSNLTGFSLAYSVLGPLGYNPPTGFGAKNPAAPAGCTITSTSLSCGYEALAVRANFSLPSGSTFTPTLDDGAGLLALNFSTNSSMITLNNIQGFHPYLILVGNGNTLTINSNGAVTPSITVIGNNNTIALNSEGGGNSFVIHIVGNDNTVTGPGTAGDSTTYVTAYGIGNTWAVTDGGSDKNYAWFNGFNPSDVTSSSCPVDGLANTNTITGFTGSNAATMSATFNNSTTNNHPYTHTANGLTVTYQSVAASTCPYVTQSTIALGQLGQPGGVISFQLANSYIPSAEVAYDQGAIAFAQEGGYPLLVDGPAISYSGTSLSLWIPQFVGSIGSTSGLGTVDLTFRLLSVQSITLPTAAFTLPSTGHLVATIVSPYAQAWYNYFSATPALRGFASCIPAVVCTGAFAAPEPVGTVTLSIPMGQITTLSVTTARYAIGLV
jgi:hypothetical protein